jgi:DNA gyrase/topoisomerase IV subunit B
MTQVVVDGAGQSFRKETYRHDGGIKELVTSLCQGKVNLHPDHEVIYFREERKDVVVEVALRWCGAPPSYLLARPSSSRHGMAWC